MSKTVYEHYVRLSDGSKHYFYESKCVFINPTDMEHPKDASKYLLDIGDTKSERNALEKKYPPYKEEPNFLVIPKTDVTTIGSHPKGTK